MIRSSFFNWKDRFKQEAAVAPPVGDGYAEDQC